MAVLARCPGVVDKLDGDLTGSVDALDAKLLLQQLVQNFYFLNGPTLDGCARHPWAAHSLPTDPFSCRPTNSTGCAAEFSVTVLGPGGEPSDAATTRIFFDLALSTGLDGIAVQEGTLTTEQQDAAGQFVCLPDRAVAPLTRPLRLAARRCG